MKLGKVSFTRSPGFLLLLAELIFEQYISLVKVVKGKREL